MKERRTEFGLSQAQVADAIGVDRLAYQKAEQRGEIPEIHFKALAKIFDVTVTDLFIEKYAPVMSAVFQIPRSKFRDFVSQNMGTDRSLGHKPSSLSPVKTYRPDPGEVQCALAGLKEGPGRKRWDD